MTVSDCDGVDQDFGKLFACFMSLKNLFHFLTRIKVYKKILYHVLEILTRAGVIHEYLFLSALIPSCRDILL